MHVAVRLGHLLAPLPRQPSHRVADAESVGSLAPGGLLWSSSDHHEARWAILAQVCEHFDRVQHALLGDEASHQAKDDLGIRRALLARSVVIALEAEGQHLYDTCKALSAHYRCGLSAARVDPAQSRERTSLVLREGWREALVDVLRGVGHARDVSCQGEHLTGREAERLLVHVHEVRPDGCDDGPESLAVRVAVTVDVTSAEDFELVDREGLVGQHGLAPGVRPGRRDDEREVDTGRDERPVAQAVRAVAASVIDAQDPHRPILAGLLWQAGRPDQTGRHMPLRPRLSPVESLLLEVARSDAALPDVLTRHRAIPPDTVAEQADAHGVLGLLGDATARHPDVWPQLTHALRDRWLAHAAWTMRATVELHETSAKLTKAGIDHVVVKGLVLGAHLYGDPLRRTCGDLDLLLRRADRERAAEVLGASAPDISFADADLADSGQTSLSLPRGTALDLHWELVNDASVRRDTGLQTDDVLGRLCVVDVAGAGVPTLDPVDTVLHLVSHTLVSGGHRLGWYVDLDRALREPALDLGGLRRRAKQCGLDTGLSVLATRLRDSFETPIPRFGLSGTWTIVGRAVGLVSPVSGETSRPHRGQLYYRATRQDTAASLRALRGLVDEARGRSKPAARSVALVSLEPWDTTWRRNQHLVSRLVGDGHLNEVVFVEPPSPGRGAKPWSPQPNVTVIRPSLLVPKRIGGLAVVGAWLRWTALRRVDVVWVNDPDLGVHCLPLARPALYDVTDDWRTFGQAPRVLKRLVAAEDRLAHRARTVVCSQVLADRWQERYGVVAAVLRNGVDLEAIDAAQPRALPGKAPHLGYVGTLHAERLDLSLVADLAKSDVGTVHLVGPSSLRPSETAALEAAGVRLHGPVPSAEVPSWMVSLDVLLSPHLVSDFTLSLDAIKSYEYLATGRPVVATPTSGFQRLSAPQLDVVNRESFVDAVRAAAETPASGAVRARDAGWDVRAATMARLLDGALTAGADPRLPGQ